jgi:hypothetical protein
VYIPGIRICTCSGSPTENIWAKEEAGNNRNAKNSKAAGKIVFIF